MQRQISVCQTGKLELVRLRMEENFIKRKLHIQKVKNCIENLDGIELICILKEDENQKLSTIKQEYFPYINSYSYAKKPDSKMNYNATEKQLYQWIKAQTYLNSHKKYYFYCSGVWMQIYIRDIDLGIKSLWYHNKYLGYPQSYGFVFVDEEIENMIEIGSDSRDEYHYLYDMYSLINL